MTDTLLMGLLSLMTGIVGFFIVREFSRQEKKNQAIDDLAQKVHIILVEISSLKKDFEPFSEVYRECTRFFGPGGEKSTIWREIDALRSRIDQLIENKDI